MMEVPEDLRISPRRRNHYRRYDTRGIIATATEPGSQRYLRSCVFCKEIFVSHGGFLSHLTRVHYATIPGLKKKYKLRMITGRFGEY